MSWFCVSINHTCGGEIPLNCPFYDLCSNNLLSNKWQSNTKDHINILSWKAYCRNPKREAGQGGKGVFNCRLFHFRGFELPFSFWDGSCLHNTELLTQSILARGGGSLAVKQVRIGLRARKPDPQRGFTAVSSTVQSGWEVLSLIFAIALEKKKKVYMKAKMISHLSQPSFAQALRNNENWGGGVWV